MEYLIAMRTNKLLLYTTWVNLTTRMFSRRRQTQNHRFSYIKPENEIYAVKSV